MTSSSQGAGERDRRFGLRLPRTSRGRALLLLLASLVAFYLIFPMLITIPISFNPIQRVQFPPTGFSLRWYEEFFAVGQGMGTRWIPAAWLSLQVAVATAVLSTIIGSLAAVPLARARFRGKNAIQTFLLLPLVVPIIVLAVGIFLLYVPLRLLGSPLGIVFGHSVIAIPYVMIIVAATLKGFDEQVEWAASSLGAGRIRTFWEVTIPLARPGILAGALFAFLTSFDELLIALFVSGTRAVTLPRLLWDFLRTEASPVIAVVSTLLMLGTIVFIALLALVQRERR
jgi:putative spermidine/putrescine transport system permease protein